ncbi:MAG: Filamentation induced by cAMP protein Fic [Candidatus Roizmanbacteria bacterium GW2011_GWA2_35_8]|uniref:Filamentation induced by cAMP protein Fic n=1 Tax=Candidatus Roizmanbacteria bacterium GW2011_GWA2_35_8 TaxID=1618479 RepID=A0A0G0CY00_9BACT|nr:MAG: Filamentation induced by cAMP protein Fic [Candidatus Roizmanbacteria bacterium GW2011_GWA2_35_8]
MRIPPKYKITSDIVKIISEIDSYQKLFSNLDIPKILKEKIQRTSLLKSSLYSARIEGNLLTLDELRNTKKTIAKTEILNISKAYSHLEKVKNIKIDHKFIKNIHQLVLNKISPDAGNFRKEASAIFNEAGIAIYFSPIPERIKEYLDTLIRYIYDDKEKFPLIKAFITHLIFEKIHPFIDGNGRTGRLLVSAVLKLEKYNISLMIPFDQYLDNYKSDYYHYLSEGLKNPEAYLIFMLNGYLQESIKIAEEIKRNLNKKETLYLTPRLEEILNTIKDHKIVTLDFIKRRFLKVPGRTLRYDLKKLQNLKLIIKIGKTKGSYYTSLSP